MFCIKPLYLVNRCASIFCKIEDVYFAVAEDESHTDRCVAERVEGVFFACDCIMLDVGAFQ